MVQGPNFEINAAPNGYRYGSYPSGILPVVTSGIPLGANLSEVVYYDPNDPFINKIKQSAGWSITSGSGNYVINDQDQIVSMDGDLVLRKLVIQGAGVSLPDGEYTLRKNPESNIEYATTSAGMQFTSAESATITLTGVDFLWIDVRVPAGETVSSLDDFYFGLTSELALYDAGQNFNPAYINYLQQFNYQTLRFLNWSKANFNINEDWSSRTRRDALSYSLTRPAGGGLGIEEGGSHRMHVPFELMIELCNLVDADMWLCVPHRYTDASMTSLAQVVNANLVGKLYLEWANETWLFSDARRWAAAYTSPKFTITASGSGVTFADITPTEGMTFKIVEHHQAETLNNPFNPDNTTITAINVSGQYADIQVGGSTVSLPTDAQIFYGFSDSVNTFSNADNDDGTGIRSAEMFALFDAQMSNDYERVVAGQCDFPERGFRRISATGSNGAEDGLAVAPYVQVNSQYVSGQTIEQLDVLLRAPTNGESNMAAIQDYVETSAAAVSKLYFYEAGLSLVRTGDAEATTLYHAYCESQLAAQILQDMITGWATVSNLDCINIYRGDSGLWGDYGAWSLERFPGQDLPRVQTVIDYAGFVPTEDIEPTINSRIYFVQGHSLFAHDQNYSNVGDWLTELAGNSGTTSRGGLTFGFVDEANQLDWSPSGNIFTNIKYNGFDSPFTGLYNKGVSQFYFMPSNFREDDMSAQFPYDQPVTTFVGHANTLVDNFNLVAPNADKTLYIHWPDSLPMGGPDLDRAAFTTYNNAAMNEYLDWHIAAQDAIIASGRDIKAVPIGPVIAWLFENEPYLTSLEFNQVYVDASPHGSDTIYFLAAIIVYISSYQQDPDFTNYTFPAGSSVRAEVQNNLPSIVNAIRTRLAFHNSNGVNVY